MKYEVVLFDADDTLFDYSLAEAHALKSVFLEHQFELMQSHIDLYRIVNQQLWHDYEKGSVTLDFLRHERFRKLFSEIQLELDAVSFSERYVDYLGEGSFLIEGADELISKVLHNGHRIAIITNGIKRTQLNRIGRSSLAHSFEHIIISEDTGFSKPHIGIFDYAFDKLNMMDKAKVLIVGDSLTSDIQGGMNYGIDTCWFNPRRKPNETSVKPTYEIQQLSELLQLL
ncbi:noncanonical pyrimidine nucleotidase, YjjG family [Paenibacillus sp. FSL H8-0548]|uniref:YjjG family noncanonical pyrimidine nucleotidase n=1 Tax=Paenibacillus sp. FSL H8-0548 TaxID=1920422 RepID=UPI00096D73DB|nr:YjjG family noncanonical pyrimidine nucleotidase [Paenibacillus sp. FSL H8-0548]OMF38359.1 noncanonical pyrimidine nucleotidase, YjjG family [Paenibacillus sp. FSL H8-0548]